MVRKVIFVGGVSYSGTTIADMILANDPRGFSCGELVRLFREPAILETDNYAGGEEAAAFWAAIRSKGRRDVYNSIFATNEQLEYIIDSSKEVHWIDRHAKYLRRQSIEVVHLLMYKTPEESLLSFRKRGRESRWNRNWVNYHRVYFQAIENWRSIPYAAWVNDPKVLQQACDFAGIPYSRGKERFWEKKQFTLAGNTSARIHLYQQQDEGFEQANKILVNRTGEELRVRHKSLYYTPPEELISEAEALRRSDSRIAAIERVLATHAVGVNTDTSERLPSCSYPEYLLRAMRYRIRGR